MGKLGYIFYEIDDCILFWEGEWCEMIVDVVIDIYEDYCMVMVFVLVCVVMFEIWINNL